MDLTKAARAALNAPVDIASHSMNSQPVPVPDLSGLLTFLLIQKKEQRKKGEVQKVVKAQIKKSEEMPRGPNSVFDFANFLDRKYS